MLPCPQAEVKAATAELERLVGEGVFAGEDCGLLHGQLPPEEKDRVLRRFKEGAVKVLVRWGWVGSLVEVGVEGGGGQGGVVGEWMGMLAVHPSVWQDATCAQCLLVATAASRPCVQHDGGGGGRRRPRGDGHGDRTCR